MDDRRDKAGKPEKATAADGREARLAQALRANLLKRKAKIRADRPAGKSGPVPPEEGGQD